MMNAMADKEFGERLKRARQAAGYKRQQDFADVIGVGRSTVAAWESGSQSPARHIGVIEKYLGDIDGVPARSSKRRLSPHRRRLLRQAIPDPDLYDEMLDLAEGRRITVEAPESDEDPDGSSWDDEEP